MRFASLSSGSDGNCSYIGTENAHVLIDCGVGIRTIEAGLKALSLSLKDIDAIFLTHEHIDHIKVFSEKRKFRFTEASEPCREPYFARA